MRRFRDYTGAFAALALGALVAAPGSAQTYPARTIRLILPFPPGGPTDLIGRLTGQKLGEVMGVSVITDNRPGASGNIGLELASKAPPDGYTVVLSSPVISLSPLLFSKLGYDPFKDLAPISLIGAVRNVLVVHPSVPAKSLKDLVRIARSNPGKLNYGSGGVGTTTHLAPELLKSLEKLNITHVPYKGSSIALTALAGGHVDMLVMAAPAAAGQIQANRVRALAVLSPERLAILPEVPTAKEQGYPNFEISVWYGILAPGGTPREIINRLNAEFTKVTTSADLKAKFAANGVDPLTSTPEQFSDYIRSESTRFAKVIKDAGIKPE